MSVDAGHIQQLLGSIRIPSCPAVLSELMAEAAKDDACGARIGALVSRDVALAAGVLKLANSPLFGVQNRVNALPQAVSYLGLRNVLNLVTGELVKSALSKQGASLNRFWDSAVMTAQVCQRLSQKLRISDPQTAYLYGLFHDAAIPLLMARFPDYVKTLQAANNAREQRFTAVEDAAHGTNHAAVGCLLARSWGLTGALSEAIMVHHDYDIFSVDSGVDSAACALVVLGALAERAISMQRRMVEEVEWLKAAPVIGDYLGLGEVELADLFDDLSEFIVSLQSQA